MARPFSLPWRLAVGRILALLLQIGVMWVSTSSTNNSSGSLMVHGFAYAPNFITKMIQEDTGITPSVADDDGEGGQSFQTLLPGRSSEHKKE